MEVRTNSFKNRFVLIGALVCCLWPAFARVCRGGQNRTSNFSTIQNYETDSNSSIQTRLRISWGGGVAQAMARVDPTVGSKNSNIQLFWVFERDSSSSIFVSDQRVLIRQHSDSQFEGLDVDVFGYPDSKVEIELYNASSDQPIIKSYQLSQIIDKSQIFSLDEENNRCSIVRAPGDRVRFKTEREHLIFKVGESFDFEFLVNELSGQQPDSCLLEIVKARSNRTAAVFQVGAFQWPTRRQPFPSSKCYPSQSGRRI